MHSDMQQCVDNCTECHATCLRTIQHCLSKGGMHSAQSHIRLMADCAQICRTSADFMLRGSEFHSETCRVCSELCERCAQDCERMADDNMMRQCADLCRRCAESCRQMAGTRA